MILSYTCYKRAIWLERKVKLTVNKSFIAWQDEKVIQEGLWKDDVFVEPTNWWEEKIFPHF